MNDTIKRIAELSESVEQKQDFIAEALYRIGVALSKATKQEFSHRDITVRPGDVQTGHGGLFLGVSMQRLCFAPHVRGVALHIRDIVDVQLPSDEDLNYVLSTLPEFLLEWEKMLLIKDEKVSALATQAEAALKLIDE